MAHDPATVLVRVTVAHDEDNRELQVALDGDTFYRSSSIPLDGAGAARFYQLTFKSLPAGSYRVDAHVRQIDGVTSAQAELVVIGF